MSRIGRTLAAPTGAVALALALAVGLIAGLVLVLIAARMSPLVALGAAMGVGGTLCLLKYPHWGLYALAFIVPAERFGRISDDTSSFSLSVTRALGFLMFAILVTHRLTGRKGFFISMPLMLWTAFVGVGILTLLHTSDLIPGVKIASGYVGNILFLLIITNLALTDRPEETKRHVYMCIVSWLLASTLIALYSIYDWHLGSGRSGGIPLGDVDPQAGAQLAQYRWTTIWEDRAELETLGGSIRRSMGSTSHAAVFGINLIMTVPFFLWVIRVCKTRWVQLASWAALGATMYCVLLSNTRAALLMAAGTLGLCVITGLVRVTIWMILGLIAAIAAIPLFVPVDIFERILDFSNYTVGKSEAMRIRIEYWWAGYRAIADHFLLGCGLANEKIGLEYLTHPIEGRSHMHNMYIQSAMDVGIFGMWLLFAFMASVALRCQRGRAAFRKLNEAPEYWMMTASLILLISVYVYALQVDVFYFPLKGFWLIAGLIIVMTRVAHLESRARAATPPLTEVRSDE
ncbi:MAG: O-antigen ligase family protein [Phycisphaerales bacterium]|nr:O-antigen ligase family protein [Phycisphaerales bacterium]